jgi:hypothetical protein
MALDVSLEVFISVWRLDESSDGTRAIFASEQIKVADKAALAG